MIINQCLSNFWTKLANLRVRIHTKKKELIFSTQTNWNFLESSGVMVNQKRNPSSFTTFCKTTNKKKSRLQIRTLNLQFSIFWIFVVNFRTTWPINTKTPPWVTHHLHPCNTPSSRLTIWMIYTRTLLRNF